jgi:creatinine amidohydrolase
MTIHYWQQLSTTDFAQLDKTRTLVLLPFGATEQHGPHLPVGTDALLVEEVLRRLAPRIGDLDAIILPTTWCTKSGEHHAFAGSLDLQPETLMAVVHDMAAGIARSGFQKLVLMNWHGGNTHLMGMLTRDIRIRHRLLTFLIDIVTIFMGPGYDNAGAPQTVDIHAGRYETSMMLAAYPQWVKPGPYEGIGSDLQRGRTAATFGQHKLLLVEGGPIYPGWETTDLTADGVIGNPVGSTAAEGEGNLTAMVDRVEAMLREIALFAYRG